MTYWKFLRPGSVGPFTGHRWATGTTAWTHATEVRGQPIGIHACRAGDLSYWLTEELWQIELAGEVVRGPDKVVADRGRLVGRVAAWDAAAAVEFARVCLGRTVHHAAVALREAGLTGRADELAGLVPAVSGSGDPAVSGLPALAGVPAVVDAAASAARSADAAAAARRPGAAIVCGYVGDAVEALAGYPVASIAYIAARAANQRGTATEPGPYLDERAWQSRWLVDRLGLRDFTGTGGQ